MKALSKYFWKYIVLIFFITACTSPEPNTANESFYFSVIDHYGRHITLKEKPERIVSLSPGITELIYLLKADSALVGISDYCIYPPETDQKAKLGKIMNVNLEKLVSLSPDLVLIGSIVSQEVVAKIENSGIRVLALDFESSVNQLFENIAILGKLLDREELADSLKFAYQNRLIQIESEQTIQKKTVYYVVGFGETGDFTAPENSFISEMIALAGGKNVGDVLSSGWQINREILFDANPDIILIRQEELANFVKTYPYTLLNAVKQNQVYPVESGWIDIVSPRNFLAINYLHSILMNDSRSIN